MRDSRFHLTPVDVRAQEFRRGLRGYDTAEVDAFRQRVAEELERLLKSMAELEQQLQATRGELRGFREREQALNDALVMAQQLKTQTEEHSRREAEVSAREARASAEHVLAEARVDERAVRKDIESAQRTFNSYLAGFRTLLERYLSEVDALDSHQRDDSHPNAK